MSKLPQKGLRRVRRDEVKADSFMKPDGLDHCLECWKDWMGRDDRDLGMQMQQCMVGKGAYGDGDCEGDGDIDSVSKRLNNEIASATDAMVRSLKVSHQWAIKRKCGLATVWNYPALDFMHEAHDACVELGKKLRGNAVTKAFF